MFAWRSISIACSCLSIVCRLKVCSGTVLSTYSLTWFICSWFLLRWGGTDGMTCSGSKCSIMSSTRGILRSGSLSFLDNSLGVFCRLWRLQDEFFDGNLCLVLCLQSHSSLLSFESFNLDLFVNVAAVASWCLKSCRHGLRILLLSELLLRSSIFDVDSKTLGGQETEPLQGLRV